MSATVDLAAALAACRAREKDEEGIEMFVALDGVAEADAEFAALLARHVRELAVAPGQPTLSDTATALEVLASTHFTALAATGHLRVINFHNTIAGRVDEYERQLADAGERFAPVSEADLLRLLDGEPWAGPRPGLIPVLYEGYRDTYEVALPLVEAAGLTAWFVVPPAFIDAPPAEQAELAERCHLGIIAGEYADGRHAMTWDELRDAAARGHEVVCHTAHHVGIADIRTEEDAERELVRSRARLEEQLDREVRGLAFLWGSPLGLEPRVDAAVAGAGYAYVVSNTKLQRVP